MIRNRIISSLIFLLLCGVLSFASAQTPDNAAKPVVFSGDVTAVDVTKIVITTKDGPMEIALAPKTVYKRVSAEKPDLSTATVATLDEISVGDKVAISALLGADKKPQPARTVYLMTKADIAQRQTKETQEWRSRGIAGRVTAVDALAGKITVEQRGLVGTTTISVTPKENIKYLRYAPDSIKFSEAKESTIAEIKPGDMVRALGDRGADGTTFAAEEIVSGAFQTRAGKVKSIDTTKNEIVVTDLASNKDLTIAVAPTSIMKKFPEEQAQRMAQFQMGGGQAGGFRPAGGQTSNPPAGGQTNAANPGGAGRGGFGGMRAGGGGGGIDDMLDRFPNITPAELKVGDVIAVSSTRSSNLDRVTAIKLLAGVEPFLRAAQMSAARQGGSGRQLDLNIPGLDGFGTP
jgi:hypothetical protein